MKKVYVAVLVSLLFGVSVNYAKNSFPTPTPEVPVENPRDRIMETQQTAYRFETLRNMRNQNPMSEEDLIKNSQKKSPLSKRDKQLTSIDAEDETKYAEFLKSSKTGFIRLQDSNLCNESSNIINAQSPCPWGVTGKATAFSFRKEIYTVSVFSDVQNHIGSFNIAGINQLGFITNLGNVELENLNLQSQGIVAMADFKPSGNIEEVKFQSKMASKGFVIGDYIYRSELPIETDNTYALRSIAYGGKAYRTFGDNKIDIFEGDERKDIIVVFRVIRKYDDGSFGIIWKELRREESPTIMAGK